MQPCVDVLGVNHQEILEKSDSIERFAEYGDTENKENKERGQLLKLR